METGGPVRRCGNHSGRDDGETCPGSVEVEEGSDSGYILKVERARFADQLKMLCEKGVKNKSKVILHSSYGDVLKT